MKIIFAAAEAAPYAKVGGLADVVGSLPIALNELGHDVTIFIPHYGSIVADDVTWADSGLFVDVAYRDTDNPMRFTFNETSLSAKETQVRVYLVANPQLFGAYPDIYPWLKGTLERDRLELFNLAVKGFCELPASPTYKPDVVHCHDWHTSPLIQFLHEDASWAQTARILTIHNMAYQGYVDDTSWLARGLAQADEIVAVSPNYAQEILHEPEGCGLSSLLQSRLSNLTGILNGLNTDLFNPHTDAFIPHHYTQETAQWGKPLAKEDFLYHLGLNTDPKIPLVVMITRLVEQKGLDLLLPIRDELSELPLQLVILGQGDPQYETTFAEWNSITPNFRCVPGFHLALSQQAYAAADALLMPSRFEPCGLGQLIAMRYGTLPVVHAVGGLKDTVIDLEHHPANGTGFAFQGYSSYALLETLKRMLSVWDNQPHLWQLGVKNGMTQDFSWKKSAEAYECVYEKALNKRQATLASN